MSEIGEQATQPASDRHETTEPEEEQVEIVPRRSTRVRKPVIVQPTKIPGDSDEDSLSDEPVRRRRRRKSQAARTVENGEVPLEAPKRKRKRATEENGEEGANEGDQPPAKKRDIKKQEEDVKEGNGTAEPEEAPAKKKRTRKKPAVKEATENGEPQEEDPSPKHKEDAASQDGQENMEEQPAKPKRIRKPKPKEPIVYVIPDVEHKTTTFKGTNTSFNLLRYNDCSCIKAGWDT